MSAANTKIDQKKREAVAELNAYRERLRQEKLARDAANLTEQARLMREHTAKAEKARADWMERKLAGIAEERQDPPARRIAKMLRKRLGDDFDAVLADIRAVNFKSLQIELVRIPADERAAELAREREALAARLAAEARTLPAPEDDEEAEILLRHGFTVEKRAAELNVGVL